MHTLNGACRILSVGNRAFSNCESLANISFSPNLHYMGSEAFSGCTGLMEADLSKYKIQTLHEQAFCNCNLLKTVQLPECLEEIKEKAFYNCEQLLSIKVPAEVSDIGSYAFGNCITLKSLELPSSEVQLMDHAIAGCKNLSFSSIKNIPNTKKQFCGFVFSSISEKEIDFLTSYIRAAQVKIPDSVIKIGARAFFEHTLLQQVQISPSVIAIGMEAFKGCNALAKINARSNSIREISQGAFEHCKSLEYFYGILNLNQVEDNVFKGCIALKE